MSPSFLFLHIYPLPPLLFRHKNVAKLTALSRREGLMRNSVYLALEAVLAGPVAGYFNCACALQQA